MMKVKKEKLEGNGKPEDKITTAKKKSTSRSSKSDFIKGEEKKTYPLNLVHQLQGGHVEKWLCKSLSQAIANYFFNVHFLKK